MSLSEFIKDMGKDGPEGDIAKTIFFSLLSSLLLFGLLYIAGLKNIEGFIPDYGYYIFLAIISYALIMPSMMHLQSYNELPCMSGMMAGMTIGMIAGFLPGFLIGATNGMFYGSVFGMGVGILLGAWNGNCCGVMGVMEGIMAGFMGGLMGAMTSVMTLGDNVRILAVIVLAISAVILLGLNYMIYKEAKQMGKIREHKHDFFFNAFWSTLLTLVTVLLMVYGPRSFLFQ